MEHITFSPKGVCSVKLDFDLEDGKLHNVSFRGGCNGNLKAIGRLVEGKDAREVADILRGNTCGLRGTSCADQFAKASSRTEIIAVHLRAGILKTQVYDECAVSAARVAAGTPWRSLTQWEDRSSPLIQAG